MTRGFSLPGLSISKALLDFTIDFDDRLQKLVDKQVANPLQHKASGHIVDVVISMQDAYHLVSEMEPDHE